MKKLLQKSYCMLAAMLFLIIMVQPVASADEVGTDEEGLILLNNAASNGYYYYDATTGEEEYIPASDYISEDNPKFIPGSQDMLMEDPTPTPRVIIGADNRTPISSATGRYASTCLVIARWPDQTRAYGTGFLINDNYVLTAGHVIYNKSHGGYALHLAVYIGETGNTRKEYILGHRYRAGGDFVDKDEWEYGSDAMYDDWGIITLDHAVTSGVGHLAAQQTDSYTDMKGYTYETQGYPQDKNKPIWGGEENWQKYTMYHTTGEIIGTKLRYLPVVKMNLDFMPGQSGSAIYRYISGRGYTAQAIGIAQNTVSKENYAILINEYLIGVIINLS